MPIVGLAVPLKDRVVVLEVESQVPQKFGRSGEYLESSSPSSEVLSSMVHKVSTVR